MRKFNVNVNGTSYVVEVEELIGEAASVYQTPVAAPVAAPTAPVAAAAPAQPKPQASAAGGTIIKCPMPGKILKTLFREGDAVKKNQKIMVLEAMKMENDIVSSTDGVISYLVKEGDDVNSQQDLAVIR